MIYSRPKDAVAFEAVYNRDHVPMAVAKPAGKTKIVATRVLGTSAAHWNRMELRGIGTSVPHRPGGEDRDYRKR